MALPDNAIDGISPLAAAGLSGGLGLASGLLGVGAQLYTNKQNIDHQLAMWEMTQSYNHPAEQMKRYLEAGLNPNLIYGQSNTAQPVNVGIAQPPNFDFLAQTGRDILSSYYQREHSTFDKLLKNAKILIDEFDGYVKQATLQDQVDIISNNKDISDTQAKKIKRELELAVELAEQGKIDTATKKLEQTAYENELKMDFHNVLLENFPNMKPGMRLFLSGLFSILEFLGVPAQAVLGKIKLGGK